MDMNYLVQRRLNAKKAYRRKVVMTVALSVIFLILFLIGLVKVILDEKKAENNTQGSGSSVSEQVTPGVTGVAGEEDNRGDSGENAENSEQQGGSSATTPAPSETGEPTVLPTAIPTETPTPTPIPKKKIALDAGHGGEDLGSTRKGLYEKDANLAIALYLKKLLEEAGYDVYMIRDTDVEVELVDRPALAIENQADLYVSIHLNSIEGDNDATQGAEVWYSDLRDDDSKTLAQFVVDELIKVIDTRNRGIKLSNGLAVLKYNEMPACLVECGFITSETERAKLFDPEYQQKIAKGIANGIKKFLPLE